MSESQVGGGGISASLRRILDGGLALTQKRVELFAVELREEKCRDLKSCAAADPSESVGVLE